MRFVGECREVFEPTRVLELTTLVEELGKRNDITRAARLDQLGDRSEDQTMILAIQVVRGNDISDLVPCPGIEHQAADQGLFGLD